ncbi:MAG TPA: hypothetical protein VJT73_17315 [Polyangiaceae bacterium]|nr:hypothetical protein [Polyangiaceae bacterium]
MEVGVTTITPDALRRTSAQRVAMACKLRGLDALYVWLAAREAVPLCTLDEEILTRGAARAQAIRP